MLLSCRMISKRHILFLVLPCLLFAHLMADDELQVKLRTAAKLSPLYLAQPNVLDTQLPPPYIKELYKVVHFDFNNNGRTLTSPHSAEIDAKLYRNDTGAFRERRDFYALTLTIQNKQATATLYDLKKGTSSTFQPLNLTGVLSKDRAELHFLADAIHKKLFGTEGIASTRILFTEKNSTMSGQERASIWIMDYDGAGKRALTDDSSFCVNPTFVPPSRGRIPSNYLYVSYKHGQSKIHLAGLQGGNGVKLGQLRGNQLMPALSQDRKNLFFISDASGNPDLFLESFNAETGVVGKPRQIYAVPYATQASPTVSPNGRQVVFVSNKDGSPRLYIMDVPPEGATIKEIHPRPLLKRRVVATAPAWSPDGSKIAFTAKKEGVRQIWIHDLLTDETTQITTGGGDKENPTWAPNSLHLAYNLSTREGCSVYMLNLNQLKPVILTRGQGEWKFPSWEPRSS